MEAVLSFWTVTAGGTVGAAAAAAVPYAITVRMEQHSNSGSAKYHCSRCDERAGSSEPVGLRCRAVMMMMMMMMMTTTTMMAQIHALRIACPAVRGPAAGSGKEKRNGEGDR